MEFEVRGLEQLPQKIDGNFEELKKQLEIELENRSAVFFT